MMSWQGDAVTQARERGREQTAGPDEVLAFSRAAGPDKWFKKDPAFDQEIASRFLAVWEAAAGGKLGAWEETPESALALVIVLDQFPRNIFRGQRLCYDCDPMARAVAQRSLARGFDRKIAHAERKFFYLPFMHSEYLPDQEHCLELARSYGEEEFARDAEQHAEIICRFGRFPHRNAIMGRSTTAQEQAFLDAGGFAG